MAQVEVKVVKSKSDLVVCYKERIELLFDVSIIFQTSPYSTTGFVNDENLFENASFTLQLSSASSQENVQKAIVFLKAVLEESPDFVIERDSFSPKDFDMVLKASQTIERQSLSVLDFDFGARELCMKGQRNNVETAKLQISQLIMGPQNFSPSCQTGNKQSQPESSGNEYHQGVGTKNLNMTNRDSGVMPGKSCEPFCSSTRDLDNNVIVEHSRLDPMRSVSLMTDAEEDFPSICGSELIDRGGTVKSPSLSRSFAEVVSLKDSGGSADTGKSQTSNDTVESVSDHSLSASSDEDSGMNLVDKTDPRYESRLEFAVKLGYTERDLDKVIIRHGMECNDDRLLHELIENSAGSGNPESENAETVAPAVPAPDIASSEVFLGVMKKVSKSEDSGSNLRHIVIDGSNVAMSHGKNVFSCRGIKIAVDWFKQRGHEEITVFVPQWRKETSRPDTPITDQEILTELEKEGIVVFTPARRIKGRRVVCYDDRFVLKLAAETNGIVVSNDNYRDLLNENKEYRTVVDERLLMYTFVNDRFMPPEDPLGRRGPTLDNFLCKEPTSPPSLPPECPYGRKCTYGNKCKYHHPERGSQPHKTVTEVLKEQATIKMQERAVKGPEPLDKARRSKPKLTRTRSLALGEGGPGEKSSTLSTLPSALQEPDSDAVSRRKSPTRTEGKRADYLREHRKKLEEMLAIASASDPACSKEQTSGSSKAPGPIAPPASRPQQAVSPVPPLGSRVSSPPHLNVPFSSNQEGQLVSGHLLLAKKLSDEASESSFFSNDSSSNRASPVAPNVLGISRQESAPFSMDKLYDRRPSLQDHYRHQQYYPSPAYHRDMDSGVGSSFLPTTRLPSGFQYTAPGFGAQCQSFPGTEKESSLNVLRRLTSHSEQAPGVPVTGAVGMESGHRDHVPLKPQYSCPPGHFPPTPAPFSTQPFGGMMRQNSSSDPQLHMTGSGDVSFNPWHAPSMPPPSMCMLDSRGPRPVFGSSEHRGQGEAQQQHLYRSTSVQPSRTQRSFGSHTGLDRQISEVTLGSHDQGMAGSSPYMAPWEMGGMYHSHPTTPTHHAHTVPHQSAGLPQSTALSPWSQGPMPPQMSLSPVKSVQQAPRSFPANQPIPPTDPRYSLYYNLCGIFAEPRVRAVMNKYPDERDPQVLCASIVSEL